MARVTAEACLRIDVRELHRRRDLRAGWRGLQRWSAGAAVSFEANRGGITFSGKVDGEPVRYMAGLSWTPCRFGGERPWFLCPGSGCGRRCAILYCATRYFLCRQCNGLAYRSQQVETDGRLLLKVEKINRRLGGDFGDLPLKPKWMHRRTFDRLMADAEEAYHGSFTSGRMARMLARSERRRGR